MVVRDVQLPEAEIADLCRRHHVRRLSLFGSILSDEFKADSDVDMLVEFEPGRHPGLAFFGLQRELSGLIGRTVDLNTRQDLSKYFRDEVAEHARPIYVQE